MDNALRHVSSINDLSNPEVETVFDLADRYLAELGETKQTGQRKNLTTYRIGRSGRSGSGSILANLFFEPSTRTRLSFASAMLRLGGGTITSADPATSSAAKGESLADTVRVVSNYADAIVIRHPRDGAAKLAAQYASVPVINGGDGAHEHPTQTLCDLFTLRRKKKSSRIINVVISGDLKGSRTIHSFVYALARFGANIMLMPGAKGMELPVHVDWRLRNEFSCRPVPRDKYERESAIDALYVTAEQPHQLSLMASPDFEFEFKLKKGIDVVYVTRFQKERWAEQTQDYMKVDSSFFKDSKYKHTSVLHPLPRVGELDIALDRNPRAAYFQQASYGVPIRMALIAALLDLEARHALEKYETGFRLDAHAVYEQPHGIGIACANPNCIVHDPYEGPYTSNKYHLIAARRLRCFYCETDIEEFLVGHRRTHHYEALDAQLAEADTRRLKDVTLFADTAQAANAGYSPRKNAPKAASV